MNRSTGLLKSTHVDVQIVEFIQGLLEVCSAVSVHGRAKECEGEKRVRRLEIDRERSGEAEREGQWSKR